jgi:hypothetical protein
MASALLRVASANCRTGITRPGNIDAVNELNCDYQSLPIPELPQFEDETPPSQQEVTSNGDESGPLSDAHWNGLGKTRETSFASQPESAVNDTFDVELIDDLDESTSWSIGLGFAMYQVEKMSEMSVQKIPKISVNTVAPRPGLCPGQRESRKLFYQIRQCLAAHLRWKPPVVLGGLE